MNKLKCYWFGYGGNVYLAEELRPLIEELEMDLITIHEWDNANIKWNGATWLSELQNADIIICPVKKEQDAKSNNRLTQSLALGKPVVCSPLPSYLKVAEKFPSAFLIAQTPEEWKNALTLLRDNEQERMQLSVEGRKAAADYHINVMGNKWLELFKDLNEKVDIIIPTYNNLKCLRLCLESIRKCTKFFHNIIIVDNGSNAEVKAYLETQSDILHIRQGRMTFAQAINVGISVSRSKYICLLNDDTIVSEGWLENMVDVCKGNIGAVGVFSNCDKGWLHNEMIKIGELELLPGINTIEQIEPVVDKIYNYENTHTEIIEREWVAFYCTLISREVINKVGLLDDKFINSGEDVDYSYRIRKAGYRIVQNFKSFVFHFGAAGRKILEKENKEEYQKNDKFTNVYLNDKWTRKNVIIYTGPAWERWDFKNLETGGIGGSETWAICLAREFDKLNYRVKVFNDCSESGIKDGNVEYLHYKEYPNYVDKNWVDYFISSRTTETFNFPIRAEKKYVMIHDIWLSNDGNYPLHLDKVDKFCVLSEWHKEFVKAHHNIPDNKIFMTQNGIDFSRFKQNVERHPHRLIYSSSPDRGLDTLLYLFDFMRNEIPDLELHVLYGFDNWEKSIKQRGNEWEINKMKELKEGLKKPGVFYHGRVDQKQLALEFLKSSLWAYPTDFEETFCITSIEAQAAGLPVIYSNYAGLQTTVGGSGIAVGNGSKGQSYTQAYRIEFVKKCLEILRDKDLWNSWSLKSLENAKKYSWENAAKNWKELFES